MKEEADLIRWFSELSNKKVSVAGGKGASLAEMYNNNFPIPPGFVITAQAYSYFIENAGIQEKIKNILDKLNIEDTNKLNESSKEIRKLIESSEMPVNLKESIIEAYEILDADKKNIENARKGALDILRNSHESVFVAVRSSATTEDLAEASFAGQQDSFLNVKGNYELIQKVKECFSSLYTPRAIYYRIKKNFKHEQSKLAVVVQKMIDSEKSGVVFSVNPTRSDNSIIIEAVWGLGEGIVSGMINPDNYIIDGDLGEFKIIESKIAEKKIAIVRDSSGKNQTVNLSEEKSKMQVLSTYEIKTIAAYSKKLEEHYKKPQDIEFAIANKEIYIVQSRPITTFFSSSKIKEVSGKIILSGLGASPGVASGTVKIIHNLTELGKIQAGDVLVTEMTNPDMVVSMQRASAIITDEGGLTSHASIVSREMGIPAVVGTLNATSTLQDGHVVTVDGNTGRIYEGKGETKLLEIKPVVPTKTKIKVIVDLPDFADRAALSGVKGVGLVRLEGIIATSGKHPVYYIKNKKMGDYVTVLYSGLNKISKNFEEIWIRTSDIRSDEYQHLESAPQEHEGNPMLGDHGIRFSLKHKEIIKAEIEAIRNLASDFPNKKFGIMIPQVISVSEFQETKKIASELSIPKNVSLGVMIETPAAVQIIDKLCEAGINFVSFGTNDLTQYMLAIDRNNSAVQELYNEMNPAVLSVLSYVIRRCKKYGVQTSICGQAGSREEMAKFLLEEGIDSISVNADAAEKVSKIVAEIESSADYSSKKAMKFEENKDIQDIILSELEENESEYTPGDIHKKKDIPLLNDAIPIDSKLF
ncbi:MAG: phosphoenolpyruvate synthase [Nanoarchaeota archaeon]